MLHYLRALIVVLSQSGACDRFHTVQQRLCRWLLTSQDRARSDEIQATQELLSQTLGVNRGSASQAASALQRTGLISYWRGRITVLERPGGLMRYHARESKEFPGAWIVEAVDLAEGDSPWSVVLYGFDARERAEAYAAEKNANG